VRFAGLRRRGVAAGADRPHRFEGDHHSRQLLAGDAIETVLDLPIEHCHCLVTVSLFRKRSTNTVWQ
jgi:hypothetical protein